MTQRPRAWLLHGAHAGDNAQTVDLAKAVGISWTVKPLRYNVLHTLPFWLGGGAGLASLDKTSRELIRPPWPDLVIATGKRSVPVALHIRAESQGRSKLVQLGRPRAPLSLFDLVLTTPQYGLPPASNLMELSLPFASREEATEHERERWAAEWISLPRPLVAVLIGAGNFPQRFGIQDAADLVARLDIAVPEGSLLLIGSPRTRADVLAALAAAAGKRARVYPFCQLDNPYRAALALADQLVVTSDSMSMIADAILSRKPVSIHQLPVSPLAVHWSAAGGPMAFLARHGILTPPRNMQAVVQRLIRCRHADALGLETPRRRLPGPEYQAAVQRIQAIVDSRDAMPPISHTVKVRGLAG
jgi:uncharacterized protein